MRRPSFALAAALLGATVVAGPSVAAAAPAGDPLPPASCGTVGPPACEAIAQVMALLAPLQPALALVGPSLGQLGQSANVLTTVLESGPDLPSQQVADAAGDILQELHALTDPVLGLLEGAGVGVAPLESALTEVQALALAPVAPAPGSTAAPADAQPASGSSGGATARSAGATAPTGFAGLSSAAAPSTVRSPAVPEVPVGSTLELGPLALPSFGLTTTPATSADELATGALVDDVVAPAVSRAVIPELPDGSRATAAVLAISTLMLAAGLLLDQLRKARHPIRL